LSAESQTADPTLIEPRMDGDSGLREPTYFFDTTVVKNRIYARMLKLPKLVYGIVGVIVFFAAIFAVITAGGLLAQLASAGVKDKVLAGVIPLAAGFGLVWVGFLIYARKVGFRAVGFGRGGVAKKIVLGLVLGLVLAAAVMLFTLLLTGTPIVFNGAVFATSSFWTGVGITFVAYMIQGSAEEFVYRSMLPKFLARKYGAIGIIVLSTIAFSIAHFVNGIKDPTVFLYTGTLGLFFVLLALATESLWTVTAMHGAYNFSVGFLSTQVLTVSEGNDSGITSQLVTTGVGILGVIIVLVVLRIKRPGWQHEHLSTETAATAPANPERAVDQQPA